MTITIVASLDDSSNEAIYVSDASLEDLLEKIEKGQFIFGETSFGEVWVNPATIRYVQRGRKNLPVSSTPGATSQSEHRMNVSPSMG